MLNIKVLFLQGSPKQDYEDVIYTTLKNGSNRNKNISSLLLNWNYLGIK